MLCPIFRCRKSTKLLSMDWIKQQTLLADVIRTYGSANRQVAIRTYAVCSGGSTGGGGLIGLSPPKQWRQPPQVSRNRLGRLKSAKHQSMPIRYAVYNRRQLAVDENIVNTSLVLVVVNSLITVCRFWFSFRSRHGKTAELASLIPAVPAHQRAGAWRHRRLVINDRDCSWWLGRLGGF